MHGTSLEEMKSFVDRLFPKDRKLSVCDIGSYDINGTYEGIFKGHSYVGVDIEPGPNVDVVAKSVYEYPFPDEDFDVVVSGQTIEHVENLIVWIQEVARLVKPGGFVCIIGPFNAPEHRHPIDCWRVLPDGMKFLLKDVAKLEMIEIRVNENDCVGEARKPECRP